MEHEWYDKDIEGHEVYKAGMYGDIPYVSIHCEEIEGVEPVYHLTIKDLQYMAELLGGKIQSVNPDEINLKFSREDIIMLAKTAGVTAEELV